MPLFNNTDINLLSKNLDGLWQRQRITAENLANSETPGYRSKEVRFEGTLKRRLETGGTRAQIAESVEDSPVSVAYREGGALRADGNNVDTEKENVEMARTQLGYLYALQSVSDYFTRLKIAMTGGR